MFARMATIGAVACILVGCPPGEGLNGGVNNLNCPPGSACDWNCNGGVCNIECEADSECDITCNGGVCNFDCLAGATCDFGCNGGVCNFDCAEGSTCYSDGVQPIADAGGAGGGAPDAGVGGAGGGHVLPSDCPGLCDALAGEAATCARDALAERGHDMTVEGCTDLGDAAACASCLNHLEVPAADCVAAAGICL